MNEPIYHLLMNYVPGISLIVEKKITIIDIDMISGTVVDFIINMHKSYINMMNISHDELILELNTSMIGSNLMYNMGKVVAEDHSLAKIKEYAMLEIL